MFALRVPESMAKLPSRVRHVLADDSDRPPAATFRPRSMTDEWWSLTEEWPGVDIDAVHRKRARSGASR